jgi:hypothetical protein
MYIQSVYAWWFDMITSRSGRFMRVILPWSSRSTRSARSGGVSVVRTSEVGPKRTVMRMTGGQRVTRVDSMGESHGGTKVSVPMPKSEVHSRNRPYPSLVQSIAASYSRRPTNGMSNNGRLANCAELMPS